MRHKKYLTNKNITRKRILNINYFKMPVKSVQTFNHEVQWQKKKQN